MKNLYNINDWEEIQVCQRIGEILIDSGKVNLVHLSMALDAQKFQKLPLGEIFMLMKVISRDDLDQALKIQDSIKERLGSND